MPGYVPKRSRRMIVACPFTGLQSSRKLTPMLSHDHVMLVKAALQLGYRSLKRVTGRFPYGGVGLGI